MSFFAWRVGACSISLSSYARRSRYVARSPFWRVGISGGACLKISGGTHSMMHIWRPGTKPPTVHYYRYFKFREASMDSLSVVLWVFSLMLILRISPYSANTSAIFNMPALKEHNIHCSTSCAMQYFARARH